MSKLNPISWWVYLSGKKTWLGLTLGVLYYGAVQVGLLDANPTVENAIVALIGVGAVHKLYKAE